MEKRNDTSIRYAEMITRIYKYGIYCLIYALYVIAEYVYCVMP